MSADIVVARDQALARLRDTYGDDAETIIADARYAFVNQLLRAVVTKPPVERRTATDRIDAVVVNRWLGIPLFAGILYGMFQLVFVAAAPLMDLVELAFGWLGGLLGGLSPAWLASLLADGVVGGVGSVLVFVPQIFVMFLAIAFLEDCGYMARAAFVMDRAMHKVGLHGRSFIPMILGFGCNIPGIMACRAIENSRDRLVTMLVVPFMSCGARLPVFLLLAAVFFPSHAGLVLFSLYAIGVLVAIGMAFVFRRSMFKGQSGHFIMELPPYRMPTLRGVVTHMWERGRHFLEKAGTLILGAVVLVWLLSSMPWGVEYAGAESWIGSIGRAIAPLFAPAGFGQWQAAVALLFGIAAKEVVVGTMGAIFGAEESMLGGAIAAQLGWSPLAAFCFMLFVLLYFPCVAAIGTMRAEAGWKLAAFAAVYTTVTAWLVATVVFQVGSLMMS